MIVDARLESARHRFPEISFKDLEVSGWRDAAGENAR
jgi:hypothetical protein